MNSPSKIPLQLQKQRQQRHNKLMKMINSYQLTRQQKNKLDKIKSHTMMEINLRFLRSQVNRNFKFPKFSKSTDILNSSQEESYLITDDNQEEQDLILKSQLQQTLETKGRIKKRPAQYFVYNLRSQNQQKVDKTIKQPQFKTYSTKVLSLQQSRRVHSLGNQRSKQKQRDDVIIRRHNPIKNSNERFAKSPPGLIQTKSLKTIKPISQTRKSSKQYLILQNSIQKSPKKEINGNNLLVQTRKLKLPQINTSKSLKKLIPIQHEKLKTQKLYQQEDIQYAIGKKLVTQTTDSGKKTVKGIQKYLKQLQAQKQLYLNNQSGKLMRKDQDKKKGNVFRTTKNSLKRQIQ